ncbi:hypothetical protein MCOR31_001849 [Pyricularia oryzae]|nr:hypothetical protein MCOR19_009000 [Pyricularia oryzae]KAI6376096.1 hypothetical protein MCOR31_001849 [Pyricularia oryzae]KAI6425790.1 hypothetical protein MCOR24_003021 [Pyricularia oryzae]KAI6470065.1 hypothetical protein MCOR15_001486 [Pyricularia oryzae]KAI6478030.1 hypothetical protein MCOR18_006415 [Pyricularia oryzae]
MWNRLLADDKSSDVASRGTGSINCLHGEGEEMVCRLSRRAPWLRQTSFCGPIFPSPRQQDYQHLPYLAASNVQTSRSRTVILILTRICYCPPATVRGGHYAQHQSAEAASGIFKSTGISIESFVRVDQVNKMHPKIDKPSDCTG